MAFSEAQKVKIRHALGFPDTFLQNNTRLESAIEVIGGRADTQAMVETILDAIDSVESSISESLESMGLKRVEDIEWYGGSAAGSIVDGKCAEGRRLCSRLSIVFGVPLVGDIFGRGGYQGDGWSGAGFQGGVLPGGL